MGYIIAIAIYLSALMIYGLVLARKKVKTTDDMITGGRKIPFIILVGSLLATWCGGGGITGSAGIIYSGGPFVGAIAFAAPPIGIILLYFIAGRVRSSNKVTVPEIMEARYGATARRPASWQRSASCLPMWACWRPSSRRRPISSYCSARRAALRCLSARRW